MKKLLALLLLPAMTGCLTSTAPSIALWPIDYIGAGKTVSAKPRYDVARLQQVVVRAPFSEQGLAVLRANGSMAFDPYNEYAAQPAQLMKGVALDALTDCGLFKQVVGAGSSARASVTVEVLVTRLALDCQTAESRRAIACLTVRLVDEREILAIVKGEGAVDAADGNFGAAFSRAVTSAFVSALGQLK